MWFLTLLSLSAAVKAQPHQWTTHSPLTAFKQLGFDHQNQQSLPLNPSFIPYSISDFSDQQPKPELAKEESKGFQQIHHPNDILSNMGVDLPPEEILGKQKISCLFAGIYLRFVSEREEEAPLFVSKSPF